MSTGNLTKKAIENLALNETLWDTQVRGLGVRKLKTCSTFVLKTNINRRQRMITIGQVGRPWTVDRARKECHRIFGNIADGNEPTRPRDGMTVTELITAYMDRYVKKQLKPNSVTLYHIIFDKHILPILGTKQAGSLTKSEVSKLHNKISTSAPTMANRAIHTLAAAFNWGIKRGMVDTNPAVGIEKNTEAKRERYLSAEEFKRLGEALRELDREYPSAVAAIILLVLTGCRLREILHLKWSEVDYDRGLLFLSDSKTGSKVIVLSEPAIRILNEQPKVCEFVIPGRNLKKPRSDLKRPWLRITELAGLEGLRIHDLRHSFASVSVGG